MWMLGLERGSSAWGVIERRKMSHLRGVSVRLTNAAFLPLLTAAAGCSGGSCTLLSVGCKLTPHSGEVRAGCASLA